MKFQMTHKRPHTGPWEPMTITQVAGNSSSKTGFHLYEDMRLSQTETLDDGRC
jgi:hypothetical protein